MNFSLILLTLSIASINWLAVTLKNKSIEYFTKPGTLVALIAWLWLMSEFQGPLIWFAFALFFSLAGDIFLMLPRERFIAGLVSFLIGHFAYIVGLNTHLHKLSFANLIIGCLVFMVALRIYKRVSKGLIKKDATDLQIPIMIYTTVISVMLFSALNTLVSPDNDWSVQSSLLISGGALLFFISDTIIAWNRFVTPIAHRDTKVMITYHLGQIGLIVGGTLNYLP